MKRDVRDSSSQWCHMLVRRQLPSNTHTSTDGGIKLTLLSLLLYQQHKGQQAHHCDSNAPAPANHTQPSTTSNAPEWQHVQQCRTARQRICNVRWQQVQCLCVAQDAACHLLCVEGQQLRLLSEDEEAELEGQPVLSARAQHPRSVGHCCVFVVGRCRCRCRDREEKEVQSGERQTCIVVRQQQRPTHDLLLCIARSL